MTDREKTTETNTCPHAAAYRYTWPGRDESFICTEHVKKLTDIADAMGLPLQVIPLDYPHPHTCQQKVSR